MAHHTGPKIYRVRSTIAQSEPLRLRRALWGVAPAAAQQAIARQDELCATELGAAERQVALEQVEVERLRQEVERQKRRLAAVHENISMYREKLAKERAARAVLAARLIEREAEDAKMVQAAKASEIRFEGVRVSAEVMQEMSALKSLVGALYRTVTGRAAIPADLPTGEAGNTWQAFVVGKQVGRTLTAPDGTVIAEEGARVTEEVAAAAEQAGLLFELLLTLKPAEKYQEL